MRTSGDLTLDSPLGAVGGKGLFTKELEAALADGRIDLAAHSYKDMPIPGNPELPILAVLAREDARDVLILPENGGVAARLPLGSSSRRRIVQLALLYPDWPTAPIRGNLQTRLGKLDSGEFGGLLLAAAGLKRLGLWQRVSRVFSPAEMLPAACQGIIALQGRREGDYGFLAGLNDPDAWDASIAERAFILGLGGGCVSPSGAHAVVDGGEIRLSGLYAGPDERIRRGELTGRRETAAAIGGKLAEQLLVEGRRSG
jgi:hydroxymethylbilane synthase